MPKLDIVNANNVIECSPQKAQFYIKNLQGPRGPKGERGEAGAALQITGTVATYEELPTHLSVNDAGKAYFVREDGKLYVWSGYEFPADGEGSQFVGPQGEPGTNGQNGTDGFSPIATVAQSGSGATISITDKNGTTTANVQGYTVDSALSNFSTNPVENRVVTNAINAIASTIYPVGAVITFYDSADHSDHLGLVWQRFAAGQMIVGYDTSDEDFDTIGNTGGEKAHTLTVAEMPSHKHRQRGYFRVQSGVSGGSEVRARADMANDPWDSPMEATGGSGAHNNMPPYITAALWRRIA